MTLTEMKPALDLLAERRRTNGYAEMEELAALVGIDVTEPFSAAEVKEFERSLLASGQVAKERPIGATDVAKYRLLA